MRKPNLDMEGMAALLQVLNNGHNNGSQRFLRWGMVVSAASLAIATVVSGIHYRRHEFDELVYHTPQWILTWQGISLLCFLIAGIACSITKLHDKLR